MKKYFEELQIYYGDPESAFTRGFLIESIESCGESLLQEVRRGIAVPKRKHRFPSVIVCLSISHCLSVSLSVSLSLIIFMSVCLFSLGHIHPFIYLSNTSNNKLQPIIGKSKANPKMYFKNILPADLCLGNMYIDGEGNGNCGGTDGFKRIDEGMNDTAAPTERTAWLEVTRIDGLAQRLKKSEEIIDQLQRSKTNIQDEKASVERERDALKNKVRSLLGVVSECEAIGIDISAISSTMEMKGDFIVPPIDPATLHRDIPKDDVEIIEALSNRISYLEEELCSSRERRRELETISSVAVRTIAAKDAELQRLKERNLNSQTNKKLKQNKKDELKDKSIELSKGIDLLKSKLPTVAALETAEHHKKVAEEQANEAIKDRDRLVKEIERLKLEIFDLQSNASSGEQAKKNVVDLRKELDCANKASKSCNMQICILKEKIRENENALKKANSNLCSAKAEINRLRSLNSLSLKKNSKHFRLKEQLRASEIEIANLKYQCSTMASHLAKAIQFQEDTMDTAFAISKEKEKFDQYLFDFIHGEKLGRAVVLCDAAVQTEQQLLHIKGYTVVGPVNESRHSEINISNRKNVLQKCSYEQNLPQEISEIEWQQLHLMNSGETDVSCDQSLEGVETIPKYHRVTPNFDSSHNCSLVSYDDIQSCTCQIERIQKGIESEIECNAAIVACQESFDSILLLEREAAAREFDDLKAQLHAVKVKYHESLREIASWRQKCNTMVEQLQEAQAQSTFQQNRIDGLILEITNEEDRHSVLAQENVRLRSKISELEISYTCIEKASFEHQLSEQKRKIGVLEGEVSIVEKRLKEKDTALSELQYILSLEWQKIKDLEETITKERKSRSNIEISQRKDDADFSPCTSHRIDLYDNETFVSSDKDGQILEFLQTELGHIKRLYQNEQQALTTEINNLKDQLEQERILARKLQTNSLEYGKNTTQKVHQKDGETMQVAIHQLHKIASGLDHMAQNFI